MKKLRFLVTFLGLFAVLLGMWKLSAATRWFTAALLLLAGAIGPVLHGWVLTNPAGSAAPVWVRGGAQVHAALQYDALSVGLVPVLALLGATPGLRLRRRATLMLIGAGLCLLIDTVILALFPLLVFYKNPFTDVAGTFLGLIAFVGAPVIIWFTLTFRELQPLLPSLRPRPLPPPRGARR